jgi:cell wall assembly regulator SMI1
MATTSSLGEMLQRVDRFLREQGSRLANGLLPGASERELAAAEVELGFALPHEVFEWFRWHNGIDLGLVDSPYLPNGIKLTSLRQAIRGGRKMREEYPSLPQAGMVYQPAWLPITAPMETTFVADCSGAATDHTAPAPVHIVDMEHRNWIEPSAPSITAMLQVWITMIDEGYWRYDSGEDDWADTYAEIPLEYRLQGLV